MHVNLFPVARYCCILEIRIFLLIMEGPWNMGETTSYEVEFGQWRV